MVRVWISVKIMIRIENIGRGSSGEGEGSGHVIFECWSELPVFSTYNLI